MDIFSYYLKAGLSWFLYSLVLVPFTIAMNCLILSWVKCCSVEVWCSVVHCGEAWSSVVQCRVVVLCGAPCCVVVTPVTVPCQNNSTVQHCTTWSYNIQHYTTTTTLAQHTLLHYTGLPINSTTLLTRSLEQSFHPSSSLSWPQMCLGRTWH